MKTREDLIDAYYKLTNSCYRLWNWRLNREYDITYTDCPLAQQYLHLLLGNGGRELIEEHLQKSKYPLVLAVTPVISTILVFDAASTDVYVKGPFFSSYNDDQVFRTLLKPYRYNDEDEQKMEGSLPKLMGITNSSMTQLATMLHFAVNNEDIKPFRIEYKMIEIREVQSYGRVIEDHFVDGNALWDMEQEMLHKIKNGDLSILGYMKLRKLSKNNILDQIHHVDGYKQNMHVLLTLISRAATEGGLPGKSARSLCADYRIRLNGCHSTKEIMALSDEIVEEYVTRVHNTKNYGACSSAIVKCREYIDTHTEKKITLEYLAKYVGYTTYHLSRTFNEEVGMSIPEYMQKAKAERGKFLLKTTLMTVDEISTQLGFCSGSYFAGIFKKQTGEVPSSYRKKHQMQA